jgi:hypothetical protein
MMEAPCADWWPLATLFPDKEAEVGAALSKSAPSIRNASGGVTSFDAICSMGFDTSVVSRAVVKPITTMLAKQITTARLRLRLLTFLVPIFPNQDLKMDAG